MRNDQKAVLRKAAKQIMAIYAEIDAVTSELDDYIYENSETLEGTDRGERLEEELDNLSMLDCEFEGLRDAILLVIGEAAT